MTHPKWRCISISTVLKFGTFDERSEMGTKNGNAMTLQQRLYIDEIEERVTDLEHALNLLSTFLTTLASSPTIFG